MYRDMAHGRQGLHGLPAWPATHGARGRRGWKKLHLGVDGSGVIVAQAPTDAHIDDATRR